MVWKAGNATMYTIWDGPRRGSLKRFRPQNPTISFSKTGRLVLNKAATVRIVALDYIENVLLLWDKDRAKVAVQPIAKKDARSYPIRYTKAGAYVSATAFRDHVGINSAKTVTFPAAWNEDGTLLEADISTAARAAGQESQTI